MTKITLLGAGSAFTQPLFTDIVQIEGLDGGTIGLIDIERPRLEVNVRLLQRILEQLGLQDRWRIEVSTDRREVLPGTDYLINTIEVSGMKCVAFDNDIPLKYGIDQCIGDTIGPGGIMKALRTVPVFLEILKDAERLCPGAMVLNYTNPMSIMTLAAVRSTCLPLVGLCHSVQGTSRQVAERCGIPYDEMVWRCGGINHLAWFTELSHQGRDLYPLFLEKIKNKKIYEQDPVRHEMVKHFGYMVTESSGHFSEYVPYFRKRKDLLKLYCREGYLGGSRFYADNWPKWRKDTDLARKEMAAGKREVNIKRSLEYASEIIEGHLFGRMHIIHGSVENTGLITNLPTGGVVEVGVLVDKQGFTPTYFGALPEQCAALCRAHMAVYELCVQGILGRDREAVIHAMMLDPLAAAVCSPAEIRKMAEELFKAERAYIPDWCVRPAPAAAPAAKSNGKAQGTPKSKGNKVALAEVSSVAARGAK